MSSDCEVIIVGGGAVGACLALALAEAGVAVAVIEPSPPAPAGAGGAGRVLALARGTCRILRGLGLWEALRPGATPIRRLHVSDRGRFGFTRIEARDLGLESLGYVVPAALLGEALHAALQRADGVELLCPARAEGVAIEPDAATVEVRGGPEKAAARRLRGRLLVAADGGRSQVRATLGISARERHYPQEALVCRVTPALAHAGTAWERFTPEGPLALLPLAGEQCGLIWTVAPQRAAHLAALPEAEFLAALEAAFGTRLGGFRAAGARQRHPLVLIESREQVRPRLVVAGNAAHTLHPVAAQGLNLSLRDVAVLAQVLADAVAAGGDPGAPSTLEGYLRWRRPEQRLVTRFTDSLVWLFGARGALLAGARDAGMIGLDLLPPLKTALARRAMGLAGRQPRLALERAP